MKILFHTCCAPCAIYPVQYLQEAGHEVVGYFYNPNIHPYLEFKQRLETAQEYALRSGVKMLFEEEYELEDFLAGAVPAHARGERCRYCYLVRLRAAAKKAAQLGFDSYSSSLLVSPYQKHELIRDIGRAEGERAGVKFYYEDFRPYWREGVRLAKEMGLYRQPYCGCIYSEKERYYKG